MTAFAGGFEFLPPKINPFQIGIGAPLGRQRCHAAFDMAAEIENVGFPVGMFAEQFLPALEEILLRFDGNVIAVTLTRSKTCRAIKMFSATLTDGRDTPNSSANVRSGGILPPSS